MTGFVDSLPQSDLYVVYSISNSPYQVWQSELLDFSVGEAGQPGAVVRLCSLDAAYPNLKTAPFEVGFTFETPSYAEFGGSWHRRFVRWTKRVFKQQAHGRFHFFCLNKPFAMKSFLDAHPDLPDEALLLWMDPDMVFDRKWDPREEVRPGFVSGQRWWGYEREWARRSTGGRLRPPREASALMFPFCISVADMRRLSESFCRLSGEIYATTKDWKSEMYALVLAMAEAGLQCRSYSALGTCNNWQNGIPDDPKAIISHYTQPMSDRNGDIIWDKRSYTPETLSRPWGRPPDPSEAATLTDRRALQTLHSLIDDQETTQSRGAGIASR